MEKDFDRWNRIKKATDAADEAARLYFREGEIWWVRLGKNIGYETDGKSREFTRPVIILKKYNQYSFLALPLTTASKPNRGRWHLPTRWRASPGRCWSRAAGIGRVCWWRRSKGTGDGRMRLRMCVHELQG